MMTESPTSLDILREKILAERQRIWNQASPAERIQMKKDLEKEHELWLKATQNRSAMGA